MEKIDVIMVTGEGFPVLQTIDNSVEGFHDAIKCETFNGMSATELGIRYGLDVFLDDNGKLFGQDTITGLFVRGDKVIDFMVGNLLICRHDDEGDSTSANMDDVITISKHLCPGETLVVPQDFKWKVAPTLLVLKC